MCGRFQMFTEFKLGLLDLSFNFRKLVNTKIKSVENKNNKTVVFTVVGWSYEIPTVHI